MDGVHLSGDKGFQHLRPAPQTHRLLGLDACLLEKPLAMRDQKRCRIGDRQIADAQRHIRVLGARFVSLQKWQRAAGRQQRRQAQHLTA